MVELLSILACPRCKGELQPRGEEGLHCTACVLDYPIRNGVPILLVEESFPAREEVSSAPPVVSGVEGSKVRFLIVEGKNKGEIIELEKASCRAVGRSLDETEKTRVFSVESTVALDDVSKKLVVNYISKQFKKGEGADSSGENSLGAFYRKRDICLRDSAVSRLHAMLFYGETGVGILDLVSKNGTFVNGVEVESKLLKKGDLIMIGTTKLRWE